MIKESKRSKRKDYKEVAAILTVEIKELKLQRKQLRRRISKLSKLLDRIQGDTEVDTKIDETNALRNADAVALMYFKDNMESWINKCFVRPKEIVKGYEVRGGMLGISGLMWTLKAYCMKHGIDLNEGTGIDDKGKDKCILCFEEM